MVATAPVVSGKDCIEAARRGVVWLLSQQGADGGWKDLKEPPTIDAYYKGSWTLSLMGQAFAAHKQLDFVKQHLLDPEGDFPQRGFPAFLRGFYLYGNGYFIIGAQKVGRYDVAMPGLRYLLSQQDPVHGGFYTYKTPAGQRNLADSVSTAIGGLSCLVTGQVEAATKAADFLGRLVDSQPNPNEVFWTSMTPDGKLNTDPPEEESRWRSVDARQKGQRWFFVGLPFAFAILLHEATGEKRHADLARWLFDFQSRGIDPWDVGSSGKAGWGCSMLYRATGEQRYRDIALRVAQNIASWQSPSGAWFQVGTPAPYGTDSGLELSSLVFDLTAEFSLWLGLIGSNLLARDHQ